MVKGRILWCETCRQEGWARPTRRMYTDRGGRTWALYQCESGRHYIKALAEGAKKERVKEM